MPRLKPKEPVRSRVSRPIAFQDATALEVLIQQLINATNTKVNTRLTILEQAIAKLSANEIRVLDLELPAKPAGRTTAAGSFTAKQIGAPLIIVQGPAQPIDDSEFGIVSIVGQVRDRQTLEIVWASARIPPKRLRIHYIIGSLEG